MYRGVVDSPAMYHPLMNKFRDYLIQMGTDGMGFCTLQMHFHSFDRDMTKMIHPEEFRLCLQKMNFQFDDQEMSMLFSLFDVYGYGYMNYEEFMMCCRGQIHPRRRQLIAWAWYTIDYNKEGWVDPEEIIGRFNSAMHPDCKSGFKTPQECFRDFMKAFEVSGEIPGKVTRMEFENYFYNVSASVERDEYFEDLMRSCWNLDYNNAGDFFARYRVMHQDGRESWEYMPNWEYDYQRYGGDDRDTWSDESMMARFRSYGIYPRSFQRYDDQWEPFYSGYFSDARQRRYIDGTYDDEYNGRYDGDWNYDGRSMSPRGRYRDYRWDDYYSNNNYYDGNWNGGDWHRGRSMSPRSMRNQSQGMMGTAATVNMDGDRARDGSPRTSPRASPRRAFERH